jgi:hypothetical protein
MLRPLFERSINVKKADFECLSEREKMLIGLTVAMMRLCDP